MHFRRKWNDNGRLATMIPRALLTQTNFNNFHLSYSSIIDQLDHDTRIIVYMPFIMKQLKLFERHFCGSRILL